MVNGRGEERGVMGEGQMVERSECSSHRAVDCVQSVWGSRQTVVQFLALNPHPTPWYLVCGAGTARLSGVFTPGRLASLALGGAGRAPGAQAHAGPRRQRH